MFNKCFLSACILMPTLGLIAQGGATSAPLSVSNSSNFPKRGPFVVLFGQGNELKDGISALKLRLDANLLVDIGVSMHVVDESTPEGLKVGEGTRKQLGVPPSSEIPLKWVLLGRGKEPVLSGTVFPDSEALIQGLASVGIESPVHRLGIFLKSHPDHSETRLDALRALQRRLHYRLSQIPKGDEDLTETVDERTWGEIAFHLEQLFKGEDWMKISWQRVLPRSIMEKRSPLMKALYRRYHAQVRSVIMRCPEESEFWEMLLRMDSALGESILLQSINELSFYRIGRGWNIGYPWSQIGKQIHRHLQREGKWKEGAQAFRSIWENMALPELSFSVITGVGSDRRKPTNNDVQEDARVMRDLAWESVLAPWIESLVRSGKAEEVPSLLSDLDEAWDKKTLAVRLHSLAGRLSRMDLARQWSANLVGKKKLALKERIRFVLNDLTLVIQNQGANGRETFSIDRYWQYFGSHGLRLETMVANDGIRKDMKWPNLAPRWVLMGSDGKVVDQGEFVPDCKKLYQTVQSSGYKGEMARIQDYLVNYPDQVFPKSLLAMNLNSQIMHLASFESGEKASEQIVEKKLEDVLDPYFGLVGQLSQDELSFHTGILRNNWMPQLWVKELPDGLVPKSVLHRLAERLENQLERMPCEDVYLSHWIKLASILNKSPKMLLERIELSPARKKTNWPSVGNLNDISHMLIRRGDWNELLEILMPSTSFHK